MTIIVSNTRITAANTCGRQHAYMYGDHLEPKQYSLSIRRGTAGHQVLQTYYIARMSGLDHKSAVSEAMDTIYETIRESDPDDYDNAKMLAHLTWLMIKYFEYYQADKFKILAVETLFTAPLINDIEFGMYLDVLIEHTTGEYRGYVDIWDHKFVNNFKSNDDLRLDGQQPKYMKVAKLNNLPIRNAIFNQIRYRSMKNPQYTDLFRRSPLLSSAQAIDTIWSETKQTAIDITEHNIPFRRVLNYSACKNCFFKDLCMTELAGEDTTLMRQSQYQARTSPLKDWMLSNV